MRKFILATLDAWQIGTPSSLTCGRRFCWWNGYSMARSAGIPTHGGWPQHHPYWRHYGWGYGRPGHHRVLVP